MIVQQTKVQDNWVKLSEDGTYTCPECENTVKPLTNTTEGIVEADIDQIKQDLKNFPTKVIYAICPICGMEFTFRLVGEDLFLEPSEEEK